MASVNGQSVREEADRIKSEFDRIAKNKKMDDESRMLFKSMLMLINLLIAIFLEKKTPRRILKILASLRLKPTKMNLLPPRMERTAKASWKTMRSPIIQELWKRFR